MDTAPGDDEAPKDPGALQTHHLGYTEKDFEGKLKLLLIIISLIAYANFLFTWYTNVCPKVI